MNKINSRHYALQSVQKTKVQREVLTRGGKIFLLLLAHIPLAFLLRNYQIFSTIHAIIILVIGLWIALTSKEIKGVIPVVAYITGAEVLWRMTGANIIWEFGKFGTVAILLVALLKHRKIERVGLPELYLFLLLPGILVTTNVFGFTTITREMISANLSGPLAAVMCMVYFRQLKTNVAEFGSWMWWVIFPIISILTLASFSTITATEINFGTESVFTTSGGYGPNQVSGLLGLGALLSLMLAIHEKKATIRNLALLLSIALLTQGVLTFSRGGIVNVFIAVPLAFLHLLGSPKKFTRVIFVILVIVSLAYFYLLPQLQEFTGGSLETRYTNISLTGREDVAMADLNLWLRNPIFGVGVGLSAGARDYSRTIATHTEYTRLLAEHGIFGLIALMCLVVLMLNAYRKVPDAYSRTWFVAIASWPLLHMVHSATRVVGVSFLLGLALVNWEEPDTEDNLEVKAQSEKSRY